MEERQDTQEELKQTQLQVRQLEGELEEMLEYFQSRWYRVRGELFSTQQRLQQAQEELTRTQGELSQTRVRLNEVEIELERSKFWQVLETQTDDPRQKRYRELVWHGWYAYKRGDRTQTIEYLKESWKYSSVSVTQTVSDWLKCFEEFAERKGTQIDVQELAGSVEWRGLMRELVTGTGLGRSTRSRQFMKKVPIF